MTPNTIGTSLQPIALIGYRGCGKTVVAREIASLIGGQAVDTDELVLDLAGKSITDIFADEGESVFRRYESQVIADVVEHPPRVLSVGGGAVLDGRNVRRLRSACFVVWLVASAETLWQRISNDPLSASQRPLLTDSGGLDEVRSVLGQREESYRNAAQASIDTTDRTPKEVAREVIALARRSGGDSQQVTT